MALQKAGQAELAAYAEAFADPSAAQAATLQSILADTAPSAFGRDHHLSTGMSVAAFRSAVPVRDYDDFRPWIDRIVAGETDVLTASPVVAFELTGGSSGGRKPVPYTAPLLVSFQRTIMAWFGDFLTHVPAIGQGRAYFAISPALRAANAFGGIPVGFDNDLAYFGPHAQHLAPLLLHDAAVETGDYDAWADATVRLLRESGDLSLISVWSPSFLTALLDRMDNLPDWPGLAMISAWADASSAAGAADLRRRLPQAVFQPKGLLATEGVFTFPLMSHPDPLPALRSVFFEFRDDAGALHLINALQKGGTYDLIVTTPGGLLRYDIGDRVICTGHVGLTPMLRFAGRAAGTDLVGEKLTEGFVAACMTQTQTTGVFVAMTKGYLLLAEGAPDIAGLDAALSRNPQYAYARRIGQLALPQVRRRDNLMTDVVRHRLGQGHRLSDIKVPVLLNEKKARAIWPDL